MTNLTRAVAIVLGVIGLAGSAHAQMPGGNCNSVATYDASSSGLTQIIPAVGIKTIMLCGFDIVVGATATQVQLEAGMGTNCATSTVALTPSFRLAANGVMVDHVSGYSGINASPGNALCVNTSAANPVQVLVYYGQYQ